MPIYSSMLVDASGTDYLEKIQVVEKVLQELGAADDKILTVLNKADLIDHNHGSQKVGFFVSAKTGQGLEELLGKIEIELDK